jgi:hypothetical protein
LWVPMLTVLSLVMGRVAADMEFAAVDFDLAIWVWMVPFLASLIVAPPSWGRAWRENDVREFLFTRAVAKGDCFWAKVIVLCGVSATLILPQAERAIWEPNLVVTTHWHEHARYLAGMSGSALHEDGEEDLEQARRSDGYVKVEIPAGRRRALAFATWLVAWSVVLSQWVVVLAGRRGWAVWLLVLGLMSLELFSGLETAQRVTEDALFLFDRHRALALAVLAVGAPLLLRLGRRRFEQLEVL